MISLWGIAGISIAYMAIFFLIALWGDRLADQGQSVTSSPVIYTLSLTVYCTAWTFYGSVGLASTNGLAFLPTYLGPTIAALIFPILLHKMVRISKTNGITSIADLISSRFGKSPWLAGLVTVVALVGATPYIALQIQALASSIDAIAHVPEPKISEGTNPAFLVATGLAIFSILFGTRSVDVTATRQGMVLAIAVEGLVKLVAFAIVGIVVTYAMYDGFFDIAAQSIDAGLGQRFTLAGTGLNYSDWFFLTMLSALAVFVLPRQFQVSVIENVDERHIRTASWLLPAYLLAINIFVLPIALAGVLSGSESGDMMVLDLAQISGKPWLVILTFLGGLSAAMAMIVVTTVALSTMVSNDLVLPIYLRFNLFKAADRNDISVLILNIRRVAIALVMLAGFLFAEIIGGQFSLVSIGLIAFVGVSQFFPALIAGLYWRDANLKGALTGMIVGVAVWTYTLMIPTFASAGVVGMDFVQHGPWNINWLKPLSLLGSPEMNPTVHGMIWSLALNTALLIVVSSLTKASNIERLQAITFVDVYRRTEPSVGFWRGNIKISELTTLIQRFIGRSALVSFLNEHESRLGRALDHNEQADAELLRSVERRLASAIGAGSARAVVTSVVKREAIGPEDVLEIIDETSQVVRYSQQLEKESRALAAATEELQDANTRLQQLDQMKDDFIATVSHELRTPLTSIRSFSEILLDSPDLEQPDRSNFLNIIVTESERLTRLINDVLDLSKIESGKMDWQVDAHDMGKIISRAIQACDALFRDRRITIKAELPEEPIIHQVDDDRMIQVIVNLLSNAAKFVPAEDGLITVCLWQDNQSTSVSVTDNGPGVPQKYRSAIFEKFHQASDDLNERPKGTGLGLTICREIVEYHLGEIWISDTNNGGATVIFSLTKQRDTQPITEF